MLDPFAPDENDPLAPEFDPADDPADLLNDVENYIARFCRFPDDHCLRAVTLWTAHAHMIEHFHTTPRLAILSPEPASGKSRVLEVLELLTPESMFCLSASPAAIFRTLQEGPVTLLFDEVDTVFSQRGKNDANEDLRGLLNAGHKRNATIPRCVGPKHEVQKFPVFCAVALAGLGDLPDTIMSRSIIIRMRRRAPGEEVESFRYRDQERRGHALRERLAGWAIEAGEAVGAARPVLPPGIEDRPADTWEPLVAIADAAGGRWPAVARASCAALAALAQDRQQSLGVRLLSDLRTIFRDADTMATADIIERLCAPVDSGLTADAPWAELNASKPINARGLARILKKYNVESQKVWTGYAHLQGYRRDALADAWKRYLPHPSGIAEHPEHPADTPACGGPDVPDVPQHRPNVPDCGSAESRVNADLVPHVPHVPLNAGAEGTPCPNCAGEGCQWCRRARA